MNKPKSRKKELKAIGLLWNWVCLGACIKNNKQQDRWLKALQEMEDEIKRYLIEGCKCDNLDKYEKYWDKNLKQFIYGNRR